jgi:hypothetical protein
MKIKNRPEDAGVLAGADWVAQLRDDVHAGPPGGGIPSGPRGGIPSGPGGGISQEPRGRIPPEPPHNDVHVADGHDAGIAAGGRAEITERAAIGDQLRMPVACCEMVSCISRHSDPAALGEADIRARAIAVGWRVDALGRLTCPSCQQSGSGFWAPHPVVLWDRNTAVTMAALMAAALRTEGVADKMIGGNTRASRPAGRGQPPGSTPVPAPRRGHHRRASLGET